MKMATTKSNSYIEKELQWLESKAQEIQEYINKTKYGDIDDRIVSLIGARGAVETIAANIEQQQKAYRDALKEYASIIEVIDKLREKEEEKIAIRGKGELSGQAKAWMESKKK